MENLRALSNDELICDLESLVRSHRQLEARLIRYLSEVEQRRLHLEQAYQSMFEFCLVRLGMSEGEAFRRITAARLARKFPIILDLLERGAAHLSGLVLLRDHLTEENHAELLAAASGKSKRAIEALVAARFPKPDAPSRIRKLPTREAPTEPEPLALEIASGPAESAAHTPPVTVTPPVTTKPPEPLAAGRYKVQFTASESLKQKLARAKDLLSHANPTGDLALIVERGLDLLLAELEKTKLGKAKRPRRARERKSKGVARATRGEVFERDGVQCTFVSADGRRCEATAFLELDHVESRALGGSDESSNLRVRCRLCRMRHKPHYAALGFMPHGPAERLGRSRIAGRLRFSPVSNAA